MADLAKFTNPTKALLVSHSGARSTGPQTLPGRGFRRMKTNSPR